MNLPFLEIEVMRFVAANPNYNFKGLVSHFRGEWREDEVADAVCFLVHRRLVSLGKYGFTAFN